MTSPEEEYILNLRYLHKNSILPLKKGNNLILSNFFPEIASENIILFNLNILSENEASLRTFDYFPLMINFSHGHSPLMLSNPGIEKEVLIRKQTIIFINSLLTIQIVPLLTNNPNQGNKIFSFEKFQNVGEDKGHINRYDEASKNIIYHLERKNDVDEMSEKESNSNVNLKMDLENNDICNPEISNYKNKDPILDEGIENPEDNFNAKYDTKFFEFDNNLAEENYSSTKQEKSHDSVVIEPCDSETRTLGENNMKKFDFSQVKEINICKKTSNKIKTNQEITRSVNTPTKMMVSKTPNLINSSKPRIGNFNQKANETLNNLIKPDTFFRRKTVIIDDEMLSNEGLEPASNSLDNYVNMSSTAHRNTRSSSKSVNNANIELLDKKRKRQELNLENKQNPNRENSLPNNELPDHEPIVNKSSDNNLNVNETVNSFPKHFEKENKKLKFYNPNQNNLSEIIKQIKTPQLEEVDILKQKCTICLDIINNISRLDKCEHEFCKECIDQWAILSNECPLCKVEFKKIIYWESDNKQITKVKKRKFKFDEEEEEPWVRNCAEYCMVCNRSNDEHLLLVCDRCSFNICHTYCAGLDLIPADDWLCSECTHKKQGKNEVPLSLSCNVEDTGSNYIKRKTLIVDDDEEIPVKNNSIVSNSNNNKNSKNINIPISYKLTQDQVNRNSLRLNLRLNLNISSDRRKKKSKLVRRSLSALQTNKLSSRYVNQNEKIQTRRKYNLRKKK